MDTGHEYLPRQAQILTTERCNLACRHCAVPAEDSPAGHELTRAQWETAIVRMLECGVSHVWFTGGEPTLRRDVPDLVRFSLSRGAERVVVVTNAVTLNDARARTYGELCRSYPRFALHVSIDGATAPTHDSLRGQNSWKRTMDGIGRLRTFGGSVAVVQSVLTARSAGEIHEYPALLEATGARGLHLFSLASVGRSTSLDESFPPALWPEVFDMLKGLRRSGIKVSLQGPLVGEDFGAGGAQVPRAASDTTPTVVIGPDGEIFPCPFLRHVPIGNIKEEVSRAALRLRSVTDQACPTCRYLPMCAGLDLGQPFQPNSVSTTHPHDHFPVTTPVPVSLR